MKLKKIILISSIIILSLSLILFLYLNINLNLNINNNKKVLSILNNVFKEHNLSLSEDYENNLPKFQIEGTDYIGFINIPKNNLSLPIKSKCSNTFLKLASACNYSNNPLIILGTNLKDSFYHITSYTVNDIISFTNTLGQTFEYKITQIKRISNLEELSQYNEKLIIVIKNYYDIKYILFICNHN